MAGLISRLLGGTARPTRGAEPVQGIGGYTGGEGPAGQTGFPGSTAQTRSNLGKSPRAVKILSNTDTGFEQGLNPAGEVRQQSYRGDQLGTGGGANVNPRETPRVLAQSRTTLRDVVQGVPATQLGGPNMKSRPGADGMPGGYINRSAAQAMGQPMSDSRDTTTPWVEAGRAEISGGVPGAQNVRNTWAQRYKYPGGIFHTYKSAPRADQAPVNPGGQATDGNVHPDRVVQEVTVPDRLVFPGDGGNLSWSVLREMPYGGRGDGARGANLNGQRRYATGQETQFWNAGQGSFGVQRLRGSGAKLPVSFTQPAPWSSQVYVTTQEVGTNDAPNPSPGQQPQSIVFSPGGQRASNSTGRRG